MKILFVTPYLCYSGVPYAGEITVLNLLRQLSSRGHEVFLISGLRDAKDRGHLDEIKTFCTVLETIEIPPTKLDFLKSFVRWCLRGFTGGLSFRKKIANSVKRFLKKLDFDIIQIEHTEIGEYIERTSGIPIIIDAHDLLLKPVWRKFKLASGVKKIMSYFKYKWIQSKELSIYKSADKIYTRSLYDKDMLLIHNGELKVSVFPPYVRITEFDNAVPQRVSNTILFLGAMDRPVNISAVQHFYDKIFPQITHKIPDARFYVVGNNPPRSIKELSERDKHVIVTGFVEDVRSFYLKASVFVAPLMIGGGIIVKILDAMAAGTPVVTTSVGNEGIEAVPDRDILIADGPSQFAEKVVRLLRDENLSQLLSENGKSFVRENFNWDRVVSRVEHDYNKLIAG